MAFPSCSTDFLYEMPEDLPYSTLDITFADRVEVTSKAFFKKSV